MSITHGFSSHVFNAVNLVENDKLTSVSFAKDHETPVALTYRNAFTAFFGRMISWVFDGSNNKSLKDRYVADMTSRANAGVVDNDAKAEFLRKLSDAVDVSSRKPLSVWVVKQLEGDLKKLEVIVEDLSLVSNKGSSGGMGSPGLFEAFSSSRNRYRGLGLQGYMTPQLLLFRPQNERHIEGLDNPTNDELID